MSAPAIKAFSPAPVITTTRTSSSRSISSNAARMSSRVRMFRAFSLSGRLTVTIAIRPRFSIRTFSNAISNLLRASLNSSPLVKALTALLAEFSFFHHALQNLRRLEYIGRKLLVEVLRNIEPDVESHQVGQAKRPHRVVVAEHHRFIDILRARDAFLQHAHRFESDCDSESARSETRRVFHRDRLFAHSSYNVEHGGKRLI